MDKGRISIKKYKGILIVGLISALIGVVIMVAMSGGFPKNIGSWIMNLGYSLMLGYGLFANRLVTSLIENRWIEWIKRPMRSIIIAFLVTTIYSSIVIFFTNWFWYGFILKLTWKQFSTFGKEVLLIEFTVLYIITLFFYARSFFNEWRESLIAEEKLKQEAISLQYKVLSNQVNPHFLFNSLNVLSSLIKLDADRAEVYVNKLSSFYRDLLSFRGKEIVSLSEEMNFVNKYIDLQKERFGESIKVDIKGVKEDDFQVIPMTVQILVENAIKHNQVSRENNLKIKIYTNGDYMTVQNSYHPYLNPVDGERMGLKNLSERYDFLANNSIVVEKTDKVFTVKVPLLKLEEE